MKGVPNGNIHPTRIFKTPDEMDELWEQFKVDLKEQAKEWIKVQYVGKEGIKKEDEMKVPMTMEGFKRFCYKRVGNIGQYFENKDNCYTDFVEICSRIKEEIRENQIIGGLLGVYNASITQRLNNLKESTETTGTVIHSGFILDTSPLNDTINDSTTEDLQAK